jgi:hypothetical protein
MLVIRRAQMEVFEAAARELFVRRMVAHAWKHFEAQCRSLGDERVAEAVSLGLERARRYGFQSRQAIGNYLNLMFTFGRDFDTDPACRWAYGWLNAEGPPEQRMAALYALAIERERDGYGFDAGRAAGWHASGGPATGQDQIAGSRRAAKE